MAFMMILVSDPSPPEQNNDTSKEQPELEINSKGQPFPQRQDDHGGRDGYAYGYSSLHLLSLIYYQKVENNSVHMYVDRHTITQVRLPN